MIYLYQTKNHYEIKKDEVPAKEFGKNKKNKTILANI